MSNKFYSFFVLINSLFCVSIRGFVAGEKQLIGFKFLLDIALRLIYSNFKVPSTHETEYLKRLFFVVVRRCHALSGFKACCFCLFRLKLSQIWLVCRFGYLKTLLGMTSRSELPPYGFK